MRRKSQTYAITILTHRRLRLFQRAANAELMIATLIRYRDTKKFLLHAFVVMPDHLHVLFALAESLAKAIQLIKAGSSFTICSQFPGEIWHSGQHEHRIRDKRDFESQKQYIANNPVRKNYENYPHVHTPHPLSLDPSPHLIEEPCF